MDYINYNFPYRLIYEHTNLSFQMLLTSPGCLEELLIM